MILNSEGKPWYIGRDRTDHNQTVIAADKNSGKVENYPYGKLLGAAQFMDMV